MLLKRRQNQDSLNEDLNIMPVLDILSTLVVFLLLTAVWYQVGSFSTEQGLGSSANENPKKPTLVATFNGTRDVTFELQDVPKNISASVKSLTFKINSEETNEEAQAQILTYLNEAKSKLPDLSDSIVIPNQKIPYENVIFIMDQINKNGIKNIGLGYRGS